MKRRASPLDLFILLALCVLGGFLGRLQNVARTAGRVDLASSVIQNLVSPVAGPAGRVTLGSQDFFSGLFAARQLTEENRRLRAIAEAANLYDGQVSRLEDEIGRLRTMAGFGPIAGKVRVPAEVIGVSAYENRIALNVGSEQGIRPDMAVQSADGLVGTVQTVERTRCEVLLVTSASLTIGAMDLDRKPPPEGLLRGEDSNTLTVTFLDPKAPVEIGDRMVTSGHSQNIPRGIYIGRVISIDSDEQFGSLRARIDPIVSVGELREVYILK